MKFTVLGAGSFGTALAILLCHNQQDTTLWSARPDQLSVIESERENKKFLPNIAIPQSLKFCHDLGQAVASSDVLLIAVPSHAFTHVCQQIIKTSKTPKSLLWISKGLDPKSGQLLSAIANQYFNDTVPKALLTGPSFAKEIATNQPTAVVVASNNQQYAQQLQQSLHSDYFRIYLSDDIIGAQLGGAIKNVLAVAVGISDGLGFGMNTRAGLMTRGLAEMTRLGLALGAKPQTLTGLSGLGDLILTCTDNQSRNRRFGLAIGQGKSQQQACQDIGQVVEGIQTTQLVYQLAQRFNVSMPITEQMYQLLYKNAPVKQVVIALTNREPAPEVRT